MPQTEKQKLDTIIIGSGPAGISAALTLKARNKNFMLFGNAELSRKLSTSHEILNYPGLFGKTGIQIASEFKAHLDFLQIPIVEKKITNIYKMGDYFSVLSGIEQFDARSIIIATGVDFGKPFAGESEFLGRGVSYCATCDGMLYKNKTVAVIAESKSQEKEAEFLASVCKKVYYLPLYKEEIGFSRNSEFQNVIEVLSEKPLEISGDLKVRKLSLKNASTAEVSELFVDGVFILRESISPSALLQGLELDKGHIAVDRKCQTNIAGCFAAGDITGTPYQYAKAVGEGNVAALSAVGYLSLNWFIFWKFRDDFCSDKNQLGQV